MIDSCKNKTNQRKKKKNTFSSKYIVCVWMKQTKFSIRIIIKKNSSGTFNQQKQKKTNDIDDCIAIMQCQ